MGVFPELGGRVCVTGGLGFIGRHLCAALVRRGYQVLCVDRATGVAAPGAPDPRGLRGVTVVRADVSRDPLTPLLAGVRAVVHLAALPGVRSLHPPSELRRHNTIAVARLAGALGPGQRLVLASTSSVYGNAERLPTPEWWPPAPVNPYALTKHGGERAAFAAAQRGGDIVVCRPFTVFGPGQRPDMAFAHWIESIASDRPVSWCARAGARREFTYVGDAARGLIAALEFGRAGEVYNLAGTGSSRVRAALHEIESVLGRRARLEARAAANEAVVTSACGRKARAELGYEPRIGLRTGIELQVEATREARLARAA